MNNENYFKDNELAYSAWVSKYRHNNESLEEFFLRIANEFGRLDNFNIDLANLPAEKYNDLSEYGKSRFSTPDKSKLFYDLFKDFGYIIPGGSVLAGVGSGKPVSLSNCFVTDTGDSIEEIFNTARNMSEVYKRRGGNGTDLSTLRPAGAAVNNAAKTTGGVVPFMELLSQVTNTIGQDGRRGALMLSLDIRHPDSPAFTVIKQDLTKVTGANVSLRICNDFMNAVENDEDYILRWPVDLIERYSAHEIMEINMLADVPYNTLFPFILEGKTVGYTKKIKAKELWDSIVHCAWKTAEPGILFWDNVLDNDPASVYKEFKAVSTNPCGLNLASL